MKVMTIYAHPADTITNCGGTLARHADAGDEVVALILTHGGRIHANKYAEEWRRDNPDPSITGASLDEIIENKKGELRRAASIIGIGEVITFDLDDNFAAVSEDVVDRIAFELARQQPDVVIMDYPLNQSWNNPHTVATMMAMAGLGRASQALLNLDGAADFHVKQVFFTSLPIVIGDSLSLGGQRNDVYVDITDVVGRKVAAMDEFVSQGYAGLFSRKLIESNNGEHGRIAGVNFAEAFCRLNAETHTTLPVTKAAMEQDVLTRHVAYSELNLRQMFPLT